MPTESTVKTVGLVTLSAIMLVFSYLFKQSGESNVSLILLFTGILLALVFAYRAISPK